MLSIGGPWGWRSLAIGPILKQYCASVEYAYQTECGGRRRTAPKAATRAKRRSQARPVSPQIRAALNLSPASFLAACKALDNPAHGARGHVNSNSNRKDDQR